MLSTTKFNCPLNSKPVYVLLILRNLFSFSCYSIQSKSKTFTKILQIPVFTTHATFHAASAKNEKQISQKLLGRKLHNKLQNIYIYISHELKTRGSIILLLRQTTLTFLILKRIYFITEWRMDTAKHIKIQIIVKM